MQKATEFIEHIPMEEDENPKSIRPTYEWTIEM
jgi:hypothetical protein